MTGFGPGDFVVGSPVQARDGKCGVLRRLIIRPVERVLTHIVVEPRHAHSFGHLVPIDTVVAGGAVIQLTCTKAEYEVLEDSEEEQFLAAGKAFATRSEAFYAREQIAPLSQTGPGGQGASVGAPVQVPKLIVHNMPLDEIEIGDGVNVQASDGAIGEFRGLIVDPSSHKVTRVVLKHGHLWGAKEVVVSTSLVTRIGADGVRLNLTKAQARDLPAH